ncbi:hypothetical protein [Brevibacillus sp. LEMMJ03]|uniref:hypothetical protein n=1 Tax=Brevibacillus sp. LEMMJ03 TaxID=2595056 RepID=UPI002106AFEC|nr:hypothetical protein [Brevibacillus sp. LEMMJ03]
MAHVKLSQWEAISLEVLRAHGTEDQEIIDRFKSGDIRPFQQIEDGRFDFAHLLDLSQSQWDLFERAVRDGYQIKFSTFNGIKTLLSLKFQQQAERDYAVHEDYLERVRLKRADVEWLRSTISPNWQIMNGTAAGHGRGGDHHRFGPAVTPPRRNKASTSGTEVLFSCSRGPARTFGCGVL